MEEITGNTEGLVRPFLRKVSWKQWQFSEVSDCFKLHKAHHVRGRNYCKGSTADEEGREGTVLIFQPAVFVFVGNLHSSQRRH